MPDMFSLLITFLMTLIAGFALLLVYGRTRQVERYHQLSGQLHNLADPGIPKLEPWATSAVPSFEQHLVALHDSLPAALFTRLQTIALACSTGERSYVPGHKQGSTVAYADLIEQAPELAALYQSDGLRELVTRIVGQSVQPTPLHDQSSCSLLIYTRPGDHIGWHYDHNFYRGAHFTVLLSLCNEGPGGLSSTRLQIRQDGVERTIATPPNTLVIFQGAKVLHRTTRLQAGEQRILLSMTFCADPRNNWLQGTLRRLKDTAYFGLRALWT